MALLIDDILLSPFKGISFIAKKIRDMAMDEIFNEEKIREELKELYVMVERGKISEEEFDEKEEELADRLEEIMAYKKRSGGTR